MYIKSTLNCFEQQKQLMEGLAKGVSLETTIEVPEGCMAESIQGVVVYIRIKGEIDIGKEIEKIKKKESKLNASCVSLEKQMNLADYKEKVAEEVQKQSNEKLIQMRKDIELMQETMKNLTLLSK